MKLPVVLFATMLLAGCVSVPRDAGFGEVEKAVADRTGHRVVIQEESAAPTSDEAVRPLLQGRLTPDRVVEIALRNNRDLQAELAELGIARADLIEAITVRNPILDGEIRFPGEPKNPFEIAVTQTLLDLFQLPARRRFGLALFEASKLRVTGAVVNFAAEVRTHYYDLQAARLVLARQRVITEAQGRLFIPRQLPVVELNEAFYRRYVADNLSVAKWMEQRQQSPVLHLLLVVNPTEDLPGAEEEDLEEFAD